MKSVTKYMHTATRIAILSIALCLHTAVVRGANPPQDTLPADSSATQTEMMLQVIAQAKQARISDSIQRAALVEQINLLKDNDNLKREKLTADLNSIEKHDSLERAKMIEHIASLKEKNKGYPVYLGSDTLFSIYTKVGALGPKERANAISAKIRKLYKDHTITLDSILVSRSELGLEINYSDITIMSITELDAVWNDMTPEVLAQHYCDTIKQSISREWDSNSLYEVLKRIGWVVLILIGLWGVIWGIRKLDKKIRKFLIQREDKLLKSLTYKDYTFLSSKQELKVLLWFLNVMKWTFTLLALYMVLPLVFSIFAFTQGWADHMFNLVKIPFIKFLKSVWAYLPNFVTILVILFIMRYVHRFVKYIFKEIETGNLQISGFHKDWASPTYSIVKFLLYAFTLIMIFPYLPMNDSGVFQGVSVFLGILFSMGSSTAISNMIAGLVITYMRPFKVGDRIKIGEMSGDVIEKTLLVTRLRTIKNEEITIPNAAVLSGNTVNFSTFSLDPGLIVYSSVTIGYDVPWAEVHAALLEAADRVELLQKEPAPFVLQNLLDSFSVDYQINAYTKEANRQALVYSQLRQKIQDVFGERNIEIMTPNYQAIRKAENTTIPEKYQKIKNSITNN